MPAMLAQFIKDKRVFINPAYTAGWYDFTENNDTADAVVVSPDRFLLSQADLFTAEGGWQTFGLTLLAGAAGAAVAMTARPSMAAHLGRGQLIMFEWGLLSSGALAGGLVGQQVGISAFGNKSAYDAHWMAYSFVKAQNRFIHKNALANAPTF